MLPQTLLDHTCKHVHIQIILAIYDFLALAGIYLKVWHKYLFCFCYTCILFWFSPSCALNHAEPFVKLCSISPNIRISWFCVKSSIWHSDGLVYNMNKSGCQGIANWGMNLNEQLNLVCDCSSIGMEAQNFSFHCSCHLEQWERTGLWDPLYRLKSYSSQS